MALNNQQAAWLQRYRSNFQKFGEALEALAALEALYFDRGYGSGGGEEILDGDLTGDNADLTAADIAAGVTAIQQAINYRDNAAVTQADYGATINTLRAL